MSAAFRRHFLVPMSGVDSSVDVRRAADSNARALSADGRVRAAYWARPAPSLQRPRSPSQTAS
eukprot:6405672-Prymnesium_polylepis.1